MDDPTQSDQHEPKVDFTPRLDRDALSSNG